MGNVYSITIVASKNTMTNSFTIPIYVMDYSYPPLVVNYPIVIHTRNVLIHQLLDFEIQFVGSFDDYSFSFCVVYQSQPQVIMTLPFALTRFKLIEYNLIII